MQDTRRAGTAVILGTCFSLFTMALHPTGAALLRDYDTVVLRNGIAHGLALLAVPLLLFGMQGFTAWLAPEGQGSWARLAQTVYACASGCVIVAGTASGLLAPGIARRMLDGGADGPWETIFAYNGMINQAFATLYVVGLGLALLLWSVEALRRDALPRWVTGVGGIVGAGLVLFMLAGRPHLDVHTFGLIVIAQAVWFVAVGWHLRQAAPRPGTGR